MKKIVRLAACAVLMSSFGVGANASILFTPSTTPQWTTDDNSSLSGSEIASITGFDGALSLLYKANAGGSVSEDGPFAASYSTTFDPPTDPEDATISWNGPSFITNAQFLVVKDGRQTPAQYIFSLLGWDGMEEIRVSGFWPDQGAISNVAIWGGEGTTVIPEPATLAVWSGLVLIGLLAYARTKQNRRVQCPHSVDPIDG